ncbi:aldo/keto reductase [Herbiconiux sp. L3-i23]|uniref:aldo/keto reductase n=1 Tax=Herbiconiux sp. L3-i23 TaxID=2905871 RepID=UPI002072CD29|nr:aldo/keto reductase [Herbiconiux sp. L3-i23]
MTVDSDVPAAPPEREPIALQVPLWDWPEPERPAPPVIPPAAIATAADTDSAPIAPDATPIAPAVVDTVPVVAEALEVVARSLQRLADVETRPVLDAVSPPFRLRSFGETGMQIFPLVLSGGTFGWTAGTDATRGILDAYADAGGNAIDTADSYAAGRSEVLIGTWLREKRNRDEIILSTKVALSDDEPGLSAGAITRAVDASLTRLGTGHIDVLYFHADDRDVPLEESLTAAEALIRAGKVRELAAVGYTAERLMEARVVAGQLTLPRFAGVQVPYNLLARTEFEKSLSPVVGAQGLAVLPHTVLGGGFLSGKYRGRRSEKAALPPSRRDEMACHLNRRGLRVLDALDEIASDRGLASATIALAWLMTKPLVTAPLVSVSAPEQVDALVKAAGVRLSRAEVVALDRASA